MEHIVECLPIWPQLYAAVVEDRSSVLLTGPRHYGKRLIKQRIAACYAERGGQCAMISSKARSGTGRLDYGSLWEEVTGQLCFRRQVPVGDAGSFAIAFEAELEKKRLAKKKKRAINGAAKSTLREALRRDLPFLVIIGGERRGNEANHDELMAVFNRLLAPRPTGSTDLVVLATDDYSYADYEMASSPRSQLLLTRIHFVHLTEGEIEAAFGKLAAEFGQPSDTKVIASRVATLTGGHPGLILELWKDYRARAGHVDGDEWGHHVMRRSDIVQDLARALEEDPVGYSHRALEYLEPGYPEQSPRISVLCQLGILQRLLPSSMVRLCPGIVRTMVEGVAERAGGAPKRIGSVVTEAGLHLFDEKELKVSDDDFVVVHLSDLHVGERHRFAISWPGSSHRRDQPSAADVLHDDLKSLGLIGRVDAIVMSGDFVVEGKEFDQFRRARDIVVAMLKKIGMGVDRLMIIPGNHDMEWDPSAFTATRGDKRVSREKYDNFCEMLKKPPGLEADLLPIISRSGRRKLRVLGLDSNRVEGPEARGIGYVSREALQQSVELLEGDELTGFEDVVTWMTVHHHIFPVTSLGLEQAQQRKASVMGNASALLQHAARFGVEIILHGHEHHPSVTIARRWPGELGAAFQPVAAVGAGSFGLDVQYLRDFPQNHYFVIYRLSDRIIIRSRVLGPAGIRFLPHQDIQFERGMSTPNVARGLA